MLLGSIIIVSWICFSGPFCRESDSVSHSLDIKTLLWNLSNPTWSPISQSAYLKNQRHWTKPRSADSSRNSSAFTAGRWPQLLLNAWVAETGNRFLSNQGTLEVLSILVWCFQRKVFQISLCLYALEHLACRQDTFSVVSAQNKWLRFNGVDLLTAPYLLSWAPETQSLFFWTNFTFVHTFLIFYSWFLLYT